MHKALKQRILDYLFEWRCLQPEKWINGGEIEKLAQEVGYKASNASRRCRELYEEGKINRRLKNGTVEYQFAL